MLGSDYSWVAGDRLERQVERALNNTFQCIIAQSCCGFRKTLTSVMKFMVIVSRSTSIENQIADLFGRLVMHLSFGV